MNMNELQQAAIPALTKELHSLLKEQFNLRMQRGSGQTVKPHLFQKVRRQIARLKTVMTQKVAEGASNE
jgi:large subunit ribosomal protein L29